MPKYTAVPASALHASSVIKKERAEAWHGGLYVCPDLGSCGLGWLQTFAYAQTFADWQDEAEWVSALYRQLYSPGNVMYCLTNAQLNNAGHRALLNIGAKQVAEFPNLTHGPNTLYVFHVNLRNARGRYCNKYGEAYEAPPVDASEVNDVAAMNAGGFMPQRPNTVR